MIDRLVAAVAGTPGCCVLDVHSDPDHNRSVLTFAGPPAAAAAGALALAAAAFQLLDLREHEGVHPRIGAIDVVPFVPLGGTSMARCVALAREVAASVAGAQGAPVYLYGEAAGPGRPRTLVELRAGGFEALVAGGLRLPPDFGPGIPHPTGGAVAVGARNPLIAFNVLLASDDPAVARRVARTIRESSGGLPAVQALGLYLPRRGSAQVSMNLLDHRRTSLAGLVSALRDAARLEGTEVRSAELVGLLPAAALDGLDLLDLPGLPDGSRTIEHRLRVCAG